MKPSPCVKICRLDEVGFAATTIRVALEGESVVVESVQLKREAESATAAD